MFIYFSNLWFCVLRIDASEKYWNFSFQFFEMSHYCFYTRWTTQQSNPEKVGWINYHNPHKWLFLTMWNGTFSMVWGAIFPSISLIRWILHIPIGHLYVFWGKYLFIFLKTYTTMLAIWLSSQVDTMAASIEANSVPNYSFSSKIQEDLQQNISWISVVSTDNVPN